MSENAIVRSDKGGYWVYVRHQGQRHYITKYLGAVSFRDSDRLAQKAADVINSEIDKGIFRPEKWKRRAKKLFTIQGYSEAWLDRIEPSVARATSHDYRNSFKNHINPAIGNEYIEDINKAKLTDLQNHIKRAPKGIKNCMDALKLMLRDAYESGYILIMPPWPKQKGSLEVVKKEIKWLEASEQWDVLENIRQVHRPIFTFIMLTGCRPSEARAFRRKDIRQTDIIFSKTFGRGETLKEVKGKKIMPFPLTESLKELFESMPKKLGPWMFVNAETGTHYSKQFNRIFNLAAKKAGVNISLNEFGRKSFAMQMLNSGEIEKGAVSHLLRHSDPRMIDHYAEYKTNPLKSVLDRIQQAPVSGRKQVQENDNGTI